MPQGVTFPQDKTRGVKAAASSSASSQGLVLSFAPAVNYGSGGQLPVSIAVADVNGDGKLDLVVANLCKDQNSCASDSLGVLFGNGDGTFQPAVTYDSGGYDNVINPCCKAYQAHSVAVADVNGDGKLDLLVANTLSSEGGFSGSVGVLLGNGDGTFQTVVAYDSGGWGADSLVVADVNGDGKPDIVVANVCSQLGLINPCTTQYKGAVGVLLGNGDGTFQPAIAYDSGGVSPRDVAVADLRGEGKLDLVVTSSSGNIDVLLGNGDGTFQPAAPYSEPGALYESAVADLNGDGKLDLLVANLCGSECGLGVVLGNGDGTFETAVAYDSGGLEVLSVAVADVNGDGKPDLVAANTEGASSHGLVSTLLGNGDGTFQPVVVYDSGDYWANSVAVADVNGDAKPDIVVANENSVGVLINTTAESTTTALVSSLNSSNFGQVITFTAVVTPQVRGTPLTGTVSFFDGVPNIGTSSLDGSGAATLTTSTLTTGTHSITAAYSGDSNYATSSSPAVVVNVADFELAATPPWIAVSAPGLSGTTALTVTPLGGFDQTISFACSKGLPSGANCSFTSTAAGVLMTITTTAPEARLREMRDVGDALFYATLLPGFLGFFCAVTTRRGILRRMRLLALLCIVGLCSIWLACGGSSNIIRSHPLNPGTPTGTSTVTVTATSGSLSHEATITLSVQ
jgi:Big-like domain-containing protein/VCBS repeat protein/FG-GAP repeat protein